MPPRNNTDKINDLAREVAVLGAKSDERAANAVIAETLARERMASTEEELKEMREKHAIVEAKLAATEERCRSLEKNSDRGWQFWLAILAAGVAILIALLKK